jgi:hypothetical protein
MTGTNGRKNRAENLMDVESAPDDLLTVDDHLVITLKNIVFVNKWLIAW